MRYLDLDCQRHYERQWLEFDYLDKLSEADLQWLTETMKMIRHEGRGKRERDMMAGTGIDLEDATDPLDLAQLMDEYRQRAESNIRFGAWCRKNKIDIKKIRQESK